MEFYIWALFQNISRIFKFNYNLKIITDTLHENVCTFMTILAEVFLEWEMFYVFLCSDTFFRKTCRLWDNVEEYGITRQATDDNILRRTRLACCVIKATYTYSITICDTFCFHGKDGYANAPEYCVIRKWSVLFSMSCTRTHVFLCFASNMQPNSRSFTITFRDFVDVMCDLCLSFLCSVQYDVTSMSKEFMMIWIAYCSKIRQIPFNPFRVIWASHYKRWGCYN
jgi:hypothetical protein